MVAAQIAAAVWDFQRQYECRIGEFNDDAEFLDKGEMCIVVHHTGNEERFSIREIEEFHRAQSWGKKCGFAYHYYVTDSAIYQLHADTAKTNHADNGWFNHRSVSVCLAGNFEERRPTVREVKKLVYTVVMLQIKHKIPPRRIYAHGDVSVDNTACCGRYLREMIGRIKGGGMDETRNKITKGGSDELQ